MEATHYPTQHALRLAAARQRIFDVAGAVSDRARAKEHVDSVYLKRVCKKFRLLPSQAIRTYWLLRGGVTSPLELAAESRIEKGIRAVDLDRLYLMIDDLIFTSDWRKFTAPVLHPEGSPQTQPAFIRCQMCGSSVTCVPCVQCMNEHRGVDWVTRHRPIFRGSERRSGTPTSELRALHDRQYHGEAREW